MTKQFTVTLSNDEVIAALMALRSRRDSLAVQLQEPRDEFTDDLEEMHRHALTAIETIEATTRLK